MSSWQASKGEFAEESGSRWYRAWMEENQNSDGPFRRSEEESESLQGSRLDFEEKLSRCEGDHESEPQCSRCFVAVDWSQTNTYTIYTLYPCRSIVNLFTQQECHSSCILLVNFLLSV